MRSGATFVKISVPSRDQAFRLRTLIGTRIVCAIRTAADVATTPFPRTTVGERTALASTLADSTSLSSACFRSVVVSRLVRMNAPAARMTPDATRNRRNNVTERAGAARWPRGRRIPVRIG